MEIPQIILAQALVKINSSSIHLELDNLLKRLELKSLETILRAEEDKEIGLIDTEIRNIVTATIYNNQQSPTHKVDKLAQILFSAQEYLKKGISNGDVRAVLIFLHVNCYLKLSLEKLLSSSELERNNTKAISEKMILLLKNIQLSTQALPDAPYWEKEIMNVSQKGFLENDISKTYGFIESLERGGRGFHFNFILESLVAFLFHLNYDGFLNALSHLQSPTAFVFYFQSFAQKDLLKLANDHSLSNKWLNFELIRQLLEKQQKENPDDSEIESVRSLLSKILIDDHAFFKQTVIYFHRSSLFNASLGVLLTSFSSSQMQEIVADLPIDKYDFQLSTRDELLNSFAKTASDEQIDSLLKLVYNKWGLYFNGILSTADFYQNGLVLTDFANYVIHFHSRLTDDNPLISSMEKLIQKIKFIDSEWSTSNSQQLTKFHLYHSELFLLTYAYKNKKLNDPQMLGNYEGITKDKVQLSRYVSAESEKRFETGQNNLDRAKDE
jgi:hypothetical protein